jgi:uncharacterized protein with GYD domain
MASYLVQCSYTQEALKALIATPQDRTPVIAKAVKGMGGKLIGAWLSFGDYDVTFIMEMPDNISAAAMALTAAAGGSLKSIKTTPLMTLEDGLAALKKAGTSSYKPVGAK